jgi:hypothetical protein
LTGVSAGIDLSQGGPDRHRSAIVDENASERARNGRGHFDVDFIRRDVDERLARFNAIADCFAPAGDRALGDRLSHRREHYFNE